MILLPQERLAKRFTPQSGRNSTAAETNSRPYLAIICFFTTTSSGISEHLGDANITLEIASFKSMGQFLEGKKGSTVNTVTMDNQ